MEMDRALEELNATKQTTAYKIVGNIMVSKTVADIKKEFSENKDDMIIKIKSMDTMELKIKEKLKDLQNKLKDIMKG